MAILIAEDESKLRSHLKHLCETNGFETYLASSYKEALDWLNQTTFSFDLIILDRMLGDGSGEDLIDLFQKKNPSVRILVLSALATSEEKAKIINRGADDYLSKPFTHYELIARVRALLRRTKSSEPLKPIKMIGNTTLDLFAHRVFMGEKQIDLSNKEYRLLSLLCETPQRVFPKYDIFDRIWETGYDIDSNVVEVTIMHLRRKLSEKGSNIQILSKRNLGYWVEI
jgi:DNA-binding response OmpR family regulator